IESELDEVHAEYVSLWKSEGLRDKKEIIERMGEGRFELARRSRDIRQILSDLPNVVRLLSSSTQATTGDLRAPVAFIRLMSRLVLQAPKSAVVNCFDAQAMLMRFGLNKTGAKAFGRSAAYFFKYAANSVLGLEAGMDSAMVAREAGQYDPEVGVTIADQIADHGTAGALEKTDPMEGLGRKINRNSQIAIR